MGDVFPTNNLGNYWEVNATFCGRVPSDYAVPIICTLFDSKNASLSTNNGLFEKYDQCCPEVANGTNTWVNRRGCGVYCYTYDYGLHFGNCVRDLQSDEGTNQTAYGYCNVIDYSVLKRGIQSGGQRVGTSTLGVLAVVLLVGVVGLMV